MSGGSGVTIGVGTGVGVGAGGVGGGQAVPHPCAQASGAAPAAARTAANTSRISQLLPILPRPCHCTRPRHARHHWVGGWQNFVVPRRRSNRSACLRSIGSGCCLADTKPQRPVLTDRHRLHATGFLIRREGRAFRLRVILRQRAIQPATAGVGWVEPLRDPTLTRRRLMLGLVKNSTQPTATRSMIRPHCLGTMPADDSDNETPGFFTASSTFDWLGFQR